MHELSLTQSIVRICEERAEGRHVRSVQVAIGQLAGVEAEAVRFCFDLCTQGTLLEDARLQIEHVSGRGECIACGQEVPLSYPIAICPCERRERLNIIAGRELLVTSMEV